MLGGLEKAEVQDQWTENLVQQLGKARLVPGSVCITLTVSEELQLLSSLRTNKLSRGISFIHARKLYCAVVTGQYSAKTSFVGQLYLTFEKIRSEI